MVDLLKVKLPDLLGSEKQISWADKIRKRILFDGYNSIAAYVHTYQARLESDHPRAQIIRDAIDSAIEIIASETSATKIIEYGQRYSESGYKLIARQVKNVESSG